MQDTHNRGIRRGRKWFAFFICLFVAILQFKDGSRAVPLATDALRSFNTFFITGDVASVASACGTEAGHDQPERRSAEGAEALGAFLYWQVVTSVNPIHVDIHAGATFNGLPLNGPLDWDPLQPTAGVWAGDPRVSAQWRKRQEGPHVSSRCPAVSRRGPANRSSRHQQAGRLSGLFAGSGQRGLAPAWS